MLTYLFTATFSDKTTITQTKKDISLRELNKNTYYDVLETIKEGKQLVLFTLTQQKLWNPTTIIVNLVTGIITLNGIDLYPEVLPNKMQLYWMMQVKQVMEMRHKGVTLISKQVMPEVRTYFLGWESEDKSIRHVVGVI